MLDDSQVTKMVRRHLRNPLLSVKSWSCQQDGNDDKGSPVFRVHGYIIDPIAYELEGTPIPFELHFSLSARPVE